MEPGTDTWLWECCTPRLFRLKLSTDVKSDFLKQFNAMIDLYDQLTEFRLKSGKVIQEQRTDFFAEYKQYTNDGNPIPLDLVNHMTTCLRAVSTAQSTRQAAFSGARESTMRGAWDELFKAACCDPKMAVSDTFFLEKSIGLPKNKSVGNASFPDVFQSRLLLLLLVKQSGVALDEPAIRNSVLSAVQQAGENTKRSESGTSTAQNRSFEPSTALVDGLYCFEYPVDQTSMGQKASDKLPGWFHSFFSFFKNPRKPKCTEGKNHTFEYEGI